MMRARYCGSLGWEVFAGTERGNLVDVQLRETESYESALHAVIN